MHAYTHLHILHKHINDYTNMRMHRYTQLNINKYRNKHAYTFSNIQIYEYTQIPLQKQTAITKHNYTNTQIQN